jgi:hypothetical protein
LRRVFDAGFECYDAAYVEGGLPSEDGMNDILRAALWLALFGGTAGTAICSTSPAAGGEAQAHQQLDEDLLQAIRNGDKTAVAKFLDEQFEFTNVDGKTFGKAETLTSLSAIATADRGATDVHSLNYGELGYLIGVQQNLRFMRVWVRRASGWRLFIYLETPIAARTPVAAGGGDCVNPCQTIPFSPKTKADIEILEAWQKLKNDEWHPNAQDWALHIADEFLLINARAERPKNVRVELIAKQQENHEIGPPGDPVQSMRMFDFGANSAVMLSVHTPYHGGKPYYNVRVWVLRDGRWQLGMSQQTTEQAAAPVAGNLEAATP